MKSSLETNQRHLRLLSWAAAITVLVLAASLVSRLVVPAEYLQLLLWCSIGVLIVLVLLVFVAILLLVQRLILTEQ